MPLAGLRPRGYRLGYGGGFYDRTLERLRARHPVLAVGFAFAAQEVAEVPTEPTDQKLDLIVTEAGLIRPLARLRTTALRFFSAKYPTGVRGCETPAAALSPCPGGGEAISPKP